MVNDPLEKMTFEDAMKELENLVDALDKGDVSLDEAIAAYDRGSQLKDPVSYTHLTLPTKA